MPLYRALRIWWFCARLPDPLIELLVERREYPSCRGLAVAKDRDEALLADLPCFGRWGVRGAVDCGAAA